jgi:hypothetical protein
MRLKWDEFTKIEDFEGYRTRDLKKLLEEHLDVSHSVILKILDRRELKELALKSIARKRLLIKMQRFWTCLTSYSWYIVLIAMFIMVLPFFLQWFRSSTNGFQKRISTLQISLKQRMIIISLLLVLGLIFEIVIYCIQFFTLLSWITPKPLQAFYSRWLPIISMPLAADPSFFLGKKSTYETNQFASNSNTGTYSLDVGPIITIYAYKYIQKSIETFAAGKLLEKIRKNAS